MRMTLYDCFSCNALSDPQISSVLGLTKGHFLSLGVDTPDDLRLIYKGVVLDKAKTIKECNVQDSDSLLVLYKVCLYLHFLLFAYS